jgi:hypothetical protein
MAVPGFLRQQQNISILSHALNRLSCREAMQSRKQNKEHATIR